MRFRNFALILVCTLTALKFNAYGNDVPINLTIPEGNLTLQEAWDLALENNPKMEEVEQRIMAAQSQLKKAKTFLYPRISVSTGYQAINATDVLDWNPTMRVTENLNQFDAGISLQWLVFDSMRSIHYLKAAKEQVKAAEQQRLDAQRVLMQQVAGVYIQSQVAIENMRIARSNCEFNERLLADAKAKYELGDVTEADMLNFSLGLAQAKTGFRNYRSEYEVTCAVIASSLILRRK